jgi:type I restriction enzyme M protein
MDYQTCNQNDNFIWNIADDCLRDIYRRGEYRNVILPMTVIRRLDAVLMLSNPPVLRPLEDITADIKALEAETRGLLERIIEN